MATARSFCFTLNNYTLNEYEELLNCDCRYIIIGKEIGENQTPHLQGYVEFGKPRKLGGLKKINNRCHWEVRFGTRDQAREYCKKENDYEEMGNWEAGGQGSRNDLKSLVTKIMTGESNVNDLIINEPEIASRNLKYLDRLQSIADKKLSAKWRDLENTVIIGEPGTGKTKHVIDKHGYEEIFTVNPEDSFPFDGYDGQKIILIDDFYGNGIKREFLLKILDGHQLRVNVKGSHRYAMWEKVYITSNSEIWTWYGESDLALKRRIKNTIYKSNDDM